MSDDIVDRLRQQICECGYSASFNELHKCLRCESADEIELWRKLAIHAWCHMGMDATCSDDDCQQCQLIKKAWENG